MICVFSFCASDCDMAIAIAEHIGCMGGVGNYECYLLYPNDVDARDIMAPLEQSFLALHIVTYQPLLNGWPDGPNQAFQEAAQAIYGRSDNQAWLWMEADCVPTSPRWLDIIQTEYEWNGRPILGRFEDTWNGSGKIIGKHVSGVAVYPHDFLKTTPLVRNLTRATKEYRRGTGLPPAFDVVIAPYTVKNCTESMSIQNYWKSHNFREENGEVVCDFQVPYGASNVVEMDAALIHGAKDFSLLDIVQDRLTRVLTEPITETINDTAA